MLSPCASGIVNPLTSYAASPGTRVGGGRGPATAGQGGAGLLSCPLPLLTPSALPGPSPLHLAFLRASRGSGGGCCCGKTFLSREQLDQAGASRSWDGVGCAFVGGAGWSTVCVTGGEEVPCGIKSAQTGLYPTQGCPLRELKEWTVCDTRGTWLCRPWVPGVQDLKGEPGRVCLFHKLPGCLWRGCPRASLWEPLGGK